MMIWILLAVSVALQCVAAFLAIRLAHLTAWRTAWLFIAGAIVLMAVHHGVMLADIVSEGAPDPLDVISEWMTMIISILLVAGLARLGPLFVERQRADQETTTLLARNQALVQALAEIVYDWRPRTGKVQWGGEYARILGYTDEEMGSDTASWTSRVHPEDLPGVLDEVEAARREGRCFEREYRFRRRDGTYVWMHDRGVLTLDAGGNLERIVGVFRDITDRKRAEERLRVSETLLTEAQRVAHIGNWNWDIATNAIVWSEEMYRIFGLPPHEGPVTYEAFLSRIHPEDRDDVNRVTQKALKERQPFDHDRRVVWPDGTIHVYHSRGVVEVDAAGKPVRMYGTAQDITERMRAEEALREREDLLRLFVEHSPAALAMFDREMRYVSTSRRWLIDFGLGDRELTGRSHYEVFPEIPERWKAVHQRCLAGAVERMEEDSFVRADGHTDWVRWEVRPWKRADGGIGGVIMFVEVITERKRAEEALRESEERYRHVVELSPESIFINLGGRIVFANPACVKLLGARAAGELVGRSPYEILHPDDHQEVRSLIQGLLERGGQMPLTERKWIRLDGATVNVEVTASVLPFAGGTAIQVLARDITERKRAEEAVRENEERLRQTVRVSDIGIFDHDHLAGTIYWSPMQRSLFGWGPDEPVTLPGFLSTVYPDDRARITAAVRDSHDPSGNGLYDVEHRIVRRDGQVRWLSARGQTFFGGEGQARHPARTVGANIDITDRKRAEEALQEASRFNQQIIANAREGIIVYDRDGRYVVWNPYMEELSGLKAERVLGRRPTDLPALYEAEQARLVMERGTMERIEAAVARAMTGETFAYLEVPIVIRQTGETSWTSVRYGPFRSAEGEIVGVIATVWEMTERKRAEEAARESEAFISSVLEHLPNMVFVKDARDLKFVRFNKAGEELLGYPREAMLGKSDHDFFPKEQADAFTSDDRDVLQGGGLVDIPDEPVRTKDKGVRILHTKKIPIADATGRPRYLLGISEDITERKRAEESAREAQRLLERTFASLNDAVLIVDADTRIITACNAAVRTVLGYTEREMIGRNTELLHPTRERYLRFGELFRSQLDAKGIFKTEYQLRHKDGRIFDSEHVVTEIRDDSGRRVSLVSVVRDITERKRAEAALREHAERLQMLSRQLVEAQEAEGRRIGRELHDDFGQILTSLKIYLQTLPGRSDPGSFSKQKADSLALIDQALDRVRNLSADLHPTVLDDLGLAAALRWMLDRQAQQAGFKTRFVSRGMEERLSPEIETTCFRIAQEALTNVVRHAKARNVRVELSRRKDGLHLVVSDDGVGFDPEAARAEAMRGRSLGLIGMEERASLVKGRLVIRSAPGKGTELLIEIPLPEAALRPAGRERSLPV